MRKIELKLELTENQLEWFKNMLRDEIEDALGGAKNNLIAALGSRDDVEISLFESAATEQQEYASKLGEVLETLQ